MRTLIFLSVAIVATGCSDTGRTSNDQADLDNVAVCFHKAVTVLQAEPETPNDLASFMHKAKSAVTQSGGVPANANFTAIRWNTSRTSLVTTAGNPIRCRVVEQTHDNYTSEGSSWFTEYEFYVPGTNHRSQTTIELAMP